MKTERQYLGIDIGGTFIKIGVVSGSGEVLMRGEVPIVRDGSETVMQTIFRGLDEFLKEHGLGLKEIQDTIEKIDPLPGAKEFLDELRSITQVVILSDTFEQFATPLMRKLGWPTIFCNTLEVADNGEITGYQMRCPKSKLTTVKALQSIGFDTIASGDSHNDLGMIEASKAGFLFKSTDAIKAEYPQYPAFEEYDELLDAIKKVL